MGMVTLTCPHCGFFKELQRSLLPPAGTRVTCPKCQGHFLLQESKPPAPPAVDFQPAVLSAADAPPAEPSPPPGFGPDNPPPSPPSFSPPSPVATPEPRRTLKFKFTGNAREYFGIWIVNTLLRIVTLGLYSPWAKVRRRRYFYANSLLDNAPFDYLADPLAILKGWLIAGAFFLLYSLGSRVSPALSIILMLVFFAVFPWVIVRSRVFNLRNSIHRNIRFSFRPEYREAYRVFLGWPALAVLTLGIMSPCALHRQKRFLVENSSYGTTRFRFHATPRDYYKVFMPLMVTVAVAGALVAGMAVSQYQGGAKPFQGILAILLSFVFLGFYFIIGVYVPTAITNVTWSSTSIGDHRFQSALRVRDLAWIYLSNAVAIPLSFGLLAPWGAVRLIRYRLEKLTLKGPGSLDSIAAAADEPVGATGEELGDMLGFDLGL